MTLQQLRRLASHAQFSWYASHLSAVHTYAALRCAALRFFSMLGATSCN